MYYPIELKRSVWIMLLFIYSVEFYILRILIPFRYIFICNFNGILKLKDHLTRIKPFLS